MWTQFIKYSLPAGIFGLLVVIAAVGALHSDLLGGYGLLKTPSGYQNNVFTAQIFFFLGLLSIGIIDRCISGAGMMPKILSLPLFRHLGKISYGMYVYHWPALLAAQKVFSSTLAVTVAALIVTYAVALVSFHTVEKFFTGQKRKFEYQ